MGSLLEIHSTCGRVAAAAAGEARAHYSAQKTIKKMATPYKVKMEIVHDGAPPAVVEIEVLPEWAPLGAQCASPWFEDPCHVLPRMALITIATI